MFISKSLKWNLARLATILFASALSVSVVCAEEEADPAEIAIGERLFLETRFAQFFFANSGGDANHELLAGDPVMDTTATVNGSLPGPFAGQSMNCSACHLVDAQLEELGGGMRSYGDFAPRSPIPDRPVSEGGDGQLFAVRNSPPLVNASLPRRGGFFFHFDAEFATMEDLVKGTLSGRNYGWLATESEQAIAHTASIIRDDNGLGELAQEFGGAYKEVLRGNPRDGGGALIEDLVLPEEFQVDVDDPATTDDMIFSAVAKIISAYVTDLAFSRDEATDEFNLSPYDVFLEKNSLDRKPANGERELEYSQRLLREIKNLSSPVYVRDGVDGSFQFHDQDFEFGREELKGLEIFLTQSSNKHRRGPKKKSGVGNCVACHAAPNFTDFNFHNTGATQKEYDAIHRRGAFKRIKIPGLFKRLAHHDRYLPATPAHPNASGMFRSVPEADSTKTDLGLWNVYANPDFPSSQQRLWKLLCEKEIGQQFEMETLYQNRRLIKKVFGKCWNHKLLDGSVALFKTPGLRDLGHSAPYMHNGQENRIEDVVEFYRESSDLARKKKLRNAAPELKDIFIKQRDVQPLTRFLKSLNEDYE
ncbi:MAG: hypothetical protein G3M78_07060 [Candidatus Nitrohelix vancouverensis]|uniref:Cytochrome c domain-containing protein n=1 Tax=Candidatus Nitrohelix vancouverensis TaxID=2705534 RepID=A0A7T0G396_9BACT|nr:MAG: hypothetical protein G3M78_07060 [Candidatus Nitrohelix vancouverensis]